MLIALTKQQKSNVMIFLNSASWEGSGSSWHDTDQTCTALPFLSYVSRFKLGHFKPALGGGGGEGGGRDNLTQSLQCILATVNPVHFPSLSFGKILSKFAKAARELSCSLLLFKCLEVIIMICMVGTAHI